MNCTQHSLSRVGQLPQERTDSPRTLRIEATCGFVKKQKQLGLCCQLDTNGEELSLFDVQTLAWNSDDGICVFLHVEHLDDFFDKGVLFLLANCLWLSQHGAESKAF